MQIILTPSDFPKNITYKILTYKKQENLLNSYAKLHESTDEDGNILTPPPSNEELTNTALKLKSILEKYVPTSTCEGTTEDLPPYNTKHLVVFQPTMLELLPRLLKAGWRKKRLIFMPLPTSDFWAYWNMDERIKCFADGSVDMESCMNDKEFLQDLLERKMTVPNGHELEPIYPNMSGLKWRETFWDEGGCATHLAPMPNLNPEAKQHEERIKRISEKMSNEQSKNIYFNTLLGNPYKQFEHYFNNTPKALQYFQYLNIKPGDCVINSWIDTGFELPYFCALMQGKGSIYNVDPAGTDRLTPYNIEFWEKHQDMMHLTRRYLSDIHGEKYFEPANFSYHSEDGPDREKIQTTSIEHLINEHSLKKVDVIKLDIEGCELDTTKAMIDVVKKHRPQLAIAVYHWIHHFWEIPELVIEACKDYEFYFDMYSYGHFEGVFYAIPKERSRKSGKLGGLF